MAWQKARTEKKENSEFHKYLGYVAKSSFVVLLSVFLSKILTYAYKSVIAREFGLEAYGLYSLGLMISGWFIALASLGIAEGLLRFMPIYAGKKDWNRLRFVFRSGLVTLFWTGLIFSAALFFSAEWISVTFFHNEALIPFVKWFSWTVIFTILASPFIDALMVFEKVRSFSFISNVLPHLVRIGFLVGLIALGLGNRAIIYSHVLGVASMLVGGALVVWICIPSIKGEYVLKKQEKRRIWSELLLYSWPILFLGIVSNIFYWVDTFFIGYYMDAYEVGVYNAAVPIALLMGFVPSLVMTVLFPLINKEYARGKIGVVRDLGKQVGKWIFILNVPLLFCLLVFPETFLQLLFGSESVRAAGALRIIALGSFAYALGVSSLSMISMLGKSRLVMYIFLGGSLGNALLNILWIPQYGIIGAAISTMITYMAVTGILFFYTYKHLQTIPLRRKVLRVLGVSIIPAFLLWVSAQALHPDTLGSLLLCISFGLVYLLLLITTGCLDNNDLFIWQMFKDKFMGREKNVKTYKGRAS